MTFLLGALRWWTWLVAVLVVGAAAVIVATAIAYVLTAPRRRHRRTARRGRGDSADTPGWHPPPTG